MKMRAEVALVGSWDHNGTCKLGLTAIHTPMSFRREHGTALGFSAHIQEVIQCQT